jgi:UDP-glucose 4-epimerase
MRDRSGQILVAGGLGYIGSHVAVELLRSGRSVVIADNLSNSTLSVLESIRRVLELEKISYRDEQLVFEKADLTILLEVDQLFRKYSIEGVIALAGKKAVGESVEKPALYYQTNLNIVTNLIETMNRFNCRKLIFSSSSTVYGERAEVPFRESQPIGQSITNPYGFTKYLIELLLANLCQFSPKFQVTSLRYFNPVGCHASGLLADNPRQPLNLMPIVMRSILEKRPFKVYGTDYPTRDGSAERDYIHVSDLAEAHVCAFEALKDGYKAFNLGLEKPVSVFEIINNFERVNGVRLDYQLAPRREGDLAVSCADCSLVRDELGWSPKNDLETIVRDCYQSLQFYRTGS